MTDLLVAAGALYIGGVFAVTTFGNIPLNNRLDKATPEEVTTVRSWFTGLWERLHSVRTATSQVAVVLVFVAAVERS